MQTVALSVEQAWELGGVLMAAGAAMSISSLARVRSVGAFARETAVIGFLYGLWQYAGRVADGGTVGAFAHAHLIERIEADLHLPSERSVQHLVLGHRLVVEGANLYYATMHISMMLVFLIWLFVRHRDRYRPVRQVMAWTTLACLLVQLVPVAPPRMLPGIVDTAMRYGQSVYSSGLPIDQLSAMPSLHVAWAVLIGYYAWRVSTSRWRILGPAHAVLTSVVVVVTGNHWWLDGVVAVAMLALCAWAVCGVGAAWRAFRRREVQPASVALDPQPVS